MGGMNQLWMPLIIGTKIPCFGARFIHQAINFKEVIGHASVNGIHFGVHDITHYA